MAWPPTTFLESLIAAVAFGVVGIALILLGFKLFDWITPALNLERELGEQKNMAVAIVVAAAIIAVSIVIAAAVGG